MVTLETNHNNIGDKTQIVMASNHITTYVESAGLLSRFSKYMSPVSSAYSYECRMPGSVTAVYNTCLHTICQKLADSTITHVRTDVKSMVGIRLKIQLSTFEIDK